MVQPELLIVDKHVQQYFEVRKHQQKKHEHMLMKHVQNEVLKYYNVFETIRRLHQQRIRKNVSKDNRSVGKNKDVVTLKHL